MRDYVLLYLNGKRHKISGEMARMTLAKYLRYEKGLTGTKIVCSEGDCGACTVLVSRHIENNASNYTTTNYSTINSCISPLYLLDCCHIVTVEGVKLDNELHPVQESMAKNHGAQCGYCTPGIICSMTALVDDMHVKGKKVTEQKAKNYLTGNLCRCTGYKPIIEAALDIKTEYIIPTALRYNSDDIDFAFTEHLKVPVKIKTEDGEIFIPVKVQELLESKDESKVINSGSTDLGVVINKGKIDPKQIVALNNVKEFYEIKDGDVFLEIGAKVSLDRVEKATVKSFKALSEFLHIFASPQIKNIGTLIGNVANGSPIGDTLPFLVAAEAILVIQSKKGKRELVITKFYKGYKDFDLADGEVITSIKIPKTADEYKIYKVSIRKDLDISAVSLAVKYDLSDDKKINNIAIAYGGVGPTVLRIPELEKDLIGKDFTEKAFAAAAKKIKTLVKPLSDHRGSKEFRLELCQNLLLKFYSEVSA